MSSMNFAQKLAHNSKKAAAEAKKNQINKLLEDNEDDLYGDIDDDMYDNIDANASKAKAKPKIMSGASIRNKEDTR